MVFIFIHKRQQANGYFTYELSTKIPYAYDAGDYIIGYTLGEDVYVYPKKGSGYSYIGPNECFSGRLKYNNIGAIKDIYDTKYIKSDGVTHFSTEDIAFLTNDLSVVLYSLQKTDGLDIGPELLPASGVTNFLQDYEKNAAGEYTVGAFHEARRKAIIKIISDCLTEEINEHNKYADLTGNTYQFSLPEITNDDWINSINDISIMAFVQGIPVGTAEGTFYNNYALGGAQIVKSRHFYAAPYPAGANPDTATWLYHDYNCSLIAGDNYEVEYISREAAMEDDCIACQLCN